MEQMVRTTQFPRLLFPWPLRRRAHRQQWGVRIFSFSRLLKEGVWLTSETVMVVWSANKGANRVLLGDSAHADGLRNPHHMVNLENDLLRFSRIKARESTIFANANCGYISRNLSHLHGFCMKNADDRLTPWLRLLP